MITSEKEYNAIVEPIDQLLLVADNIENKDTNGYIELNLLSDVVAEYESRHYTVKIPSLFDVIKLRMA